jgi:hypothetical protein
VVKEVLENNMTQTVDERLQVLAAMPESPPARGIGRVLRAVFSWPVFLGAMASGAAVIATTWMNPPLIGGKLFVEGDTWWHLAVGDRILSTLTWPTVDPYSFTIRGAPWIAYEWLGEVVMSIAHRVAGLQGLAALLLFLAVTVAVLIYYYAWLRSGTHLAAAAATVLVIPVAAACFTMRPQMIGYCFLLITLICLERFQQRRENSLWILPPVFLLWVNTHGSIAVGFLALGLYLVSGLVAFRSGFLVSSRWTAAQRRHLLLILLLCLLAATVTPYGTRLAAYPLEITLRQPLVARLVVEWQPLQLASPYGQAFLALLLIILLAQIVAPVNYRVEILALVLFATAETCLHTRFLIIFAIIVAPVLATLFARWLPAYRKSEDHPVANAILVGCALLGILAAFPSRAKLRQALSRRYPVGAAHYLRQHSTAGNLLNARRWGGYMIWALPGHGVFIDGRDDIYEYGGVLLDYHNFTGVRMSPETFLGRYDIGAALIERGTPMETYFGVLPGWRKAYQDSNSLIFVRSDKQR